MILNGYRFGERGRGSSSAGRPTQYWQCTANFRDSKTGKTKRCLARINTMIIDGYEMIRNPHVTHDHPQDPNKYFK